MLFNKIIFCSALILCLLVNRPTVSGVTDDFTIQLHDEHLTLITEKAPLYSILTKLSSQGVIVKFDPQINPLITANYTDRPVAQVFRAILNDASFSLLWESKRDEEGSAGIKLAEIQIFKSGRKDLMKQLRPSPNITTIVQDSDGSFHVKNEILLQLAAGSDITELANFLRLYNAAIRQTKIPGIYRITFPEHIDAQDLIRDIRDIAGINSAGLNHAYPMPQPVSHTRPYQIPAPEIRSNAPLNNLAPIAILDSGLSTGALDSEKFVISTLDVLNPEMGISDSLGHGTQMALIATGLIDPSGARDESSDYNNAIIAIRAFDENGYITDSNIIDSIDFALDNKAKILSLSWGTETNSAFMEKAIEYASTRGLIIVAAAGNEPTGKPFYPAAYASVIGVGALGHNGTEKWHKSNYGDFVDLYAPGFANLPVGYNGTPGVYAGTSISTAYVAHFISGFLAQNPNATSKDVIEFLSRQK